MNLIPGFISNFVERRKNEQFPPLEPEFVRSLLGDELFFLLSDIVAFENNFLNLSFGEKKYYSSEISPANPELSSIYKHYEQPRTFDIDHLPFREFKKGNINIGFTEKSQRFFAADEKSVSECIWVAGISKSNNQPYIVNEQALREKLTKLGMLLCKHDKPDHAIRECAELLFKLEDFIEKQRIGTINTANMRYRICPENLFKEMFAEKREKEEAERTAAEEAAKAADPKHIAIRELSRITGASVSTIYCGYAIPVHSREIAYDLQELLFSKRFDAWFFDFDEKGACLIPTEENFMSVHGRPGLCVAISYSSLRTPEDMQRLSEELGFQLKELASVKHAAQNLSEAYLKDGIG